MKKILVTGGSGFIGRPACVALRDLDFDVLSPDRSTLDVLNADFKTLDFWMETHRPSHCLHLAWSVTPGVFWSDPLNIDWIQSSLRLYQSFVRHGGKHFIGAGTCAEYSWEERVTELPLNEYRSQLIPTTLYGRSKKQLYQTLRDQVARDGVRFAWGRLFNLYGPHEKSGRLISDAITCFRSHQTFHATEGKQIRDFMHCEDAGSAFAAVCASNIQGAVNIASGQIVSVRDLLEDLATLMCANNCLVLGSKPYPPNDPLRLVADIHRLQHEIGFRPHFSIISGLAQTIAQWK